MAAGAERPTIDKDGAGVLRRTGAGSERSELRILSSKEDAGWREGRL